MQAMVRRVGSGRSSKSLGLFCAGVALALLFVAPGAVAQLGTPLAPEFTNPTELNAATSFGGHVSTDPETDQAIPQRGDIKITSSSFGQPFSEGAAIADFGLVLRELASKLLFYQPGAPADQNERAAFRYRQRLFGVDEFGETLDTLASNDAPSAQNVQDRIALLEENRDALLEELYGPDEAAQVDQALGLVKQALLYDPTNEDFQNLWLDIVYYQVEIALIKAKAKMARGYRQNIFPTDPLLPVISNEVNLFEEALGILDGALDPYFEYLRGNILGEPLEIPVGDYFAGSANAQDDPTYGLFVFRELVPRRSATSGSLITRDGGTLPVRPGEGEGNVVAPAGLALSSARHSETFQVLTDTAATTWQVDVDEFEDWIAVIDYDGPTTGNGTFTVEVDPNFDVERSAAIDVTFTEGAETGTVAVTIMQDAQGEPADGLLSVTPLSVALSPDGGIVTLDITKTDSDGDPVSWTVSIEVGDDWLQPSAGSEQGIDDAVIELAFEENSGAVGRLAAVRIQAFDATGDPAGIPITVEATQPPPQPESVLYAGFKDYILVFEVLKEQARAASELVHRYALRGGREDLVNAQEAVRSILGPRCVEGDLLTSILDWRSNSSGATGAARDRLYCAYNGWHTARQALLAKDQFIKGERNLLGFDPEFLMLVQRFERVSGDIFDSFDALVAFNYDTPSDVSPLKFAAKKLEDARDSFFNYRESLDTLKEQFRTQNLDVRDRLRELTGVDPGQDIDNPPASYVDFDRNPNGKLAQQLGNIALAQTRVDIGNAETDVLKKQISNEAAIRDKEQGVAEDVRGIITDYGAKQGDLEYEIGQVEGWQRVGDNAAEGIQAVSDAAITIATGNALGGLGVGASIGAIAVGYVGNATAQYFLEEEKGELRRSKEEYAAQEQAKIRMKEAALQEYIRDRTLKELSAQMRVADLQGIEALQVKGQEEGRRLLLLTEKQALEQRMRENNEALVDRLFADPLYRTMYQADTAEAQRAFEEAQDWVFFMVRALEYKWNTPFFYSYGGKDYSLQSVFSARNAEELEEFVAAMISYDGLLQASGRGDMRRDVVSFVEDILGLDRFDLDGTPVLYKDPQNTQNEVDAGTLLRRYLKGRTSDDGIIELHFSTAKFMGDTFFRGPTYNDSGTLIDRGLYLDKIVSMQINLVGNPPEGALPSVPGTLTYAGSSFIRNQYVGTRAEADRIVGEFTTYPTRFWYFDPGSPDLGVEQGWKYRDGQQASVALNLSGPTEPDEDQNLITVFKERSVATSDWTLVIYTRNARGDTLLEVDWLDDIGIVFEHTAKDRP